MTKRLLYRPYRAHIKNKPGAIPAYIGILAGMDDSPQIPRCHAAGYW